MAQRKLYVIVGPDSIIAGTGNNVFVYEYYSTTSAFLSGEIKSSQSAYLEGESATQQKQATKQVVDSTDTNVVDSSATLVVATLDVYFGFTHAFLEGETSGTPATDSSPVFLSGIADLTNSTSVFLEGIEPSSSTPAFLQGKDLSSTTEAFLAGIFSATDSSSAFLEGGLPKYKKYKKVTVDSSYVPSTQTDFPFLLKLRSDDDLRTVANGGYVENTVSDGGASGSLTVPCDMAFSADKFNNTVYEFEYEYYDPTTGELWVWILIPSLSGSTDTDFYITFGNDNITSSQEQIEEIWNAGDGYEFVLHCVESSGQRHDSTDNNRHASEYGSVGRYDGTGSEPVPLKYGAEIGTGSNNNALSIPYDTDITGQNDFTIEVWTKAYTAPPSEHKVVLGIGEFGTNGIYLMLATFNKYQAGYNGKSNVAQYTAGTSANLYGLVLDTTADYWYFYRDAALNDSYYNPGTVTISNNSPFIIGAQPDDKDARNWEGWIDEVRYYKGVRDEDYFETVHNMCKDYYQTAVFITLGTLEDVVQRTSLSAFLEGFTPGESTQAAFLSGIAEETSSVPAFLQSGGFPQSSQSAYLSGPIPVSTAQSAFLTGPFPSTSSQTAFMYGNPPPETAAVSAWLWADWPEVPPEVKSSTHGYLEGDGSFPFSDDFTGADGEDWDTIKWDTGYS